MFAPKPGVYGVAGADVSRTRTGCEFVQLFVAMQVMFLHHFWSPQWMQHSKFVFLDEKTVNEIAISAFNAEILQCRNIFLLRHLQGPVRLARQRQVSEMNRVKKRLPTP